MITSKLTSKAPTTIPLPVRNALRLGEGDEIAYRIEGDHVILTKADRGAADDPLAHRAWRRCRALLAPRTAKELGRFALSRTRR